MSSVNRSQNYPTDDEPPFHWDALTVLERWPDHRQQEQNRRHGDRKTGDPRRGDTIWAICIRLQFAQLKQREADDNKRGDERNGGGGNKRVNRAATQKSHTQA